MDRSIEDIRQAICTFPIVYFNSSKRHRKPLTSNRKEEYHYERQNDYLAAFS
jgi:hypothetical protein